MNVFKDYGRYFDLLYSDKDYASEAAYAHETIQKHNPGACSILDLGCGTGTHAIHLAALGYKIHGVDRSLEMLEAANQRLKTLPPAIAKSLFFKQGDIRQVQMEAHYDAAIALFHVISYLPTNEDLKSAFSIARSHLNPKGIFLFDCWYGPAVLTIPPEVRTKRIEDDVIRVVRIADPVMHANKNLVDVNYEIIVMQKSGKRYKVLQESHRMRYLFMPETEYLLSDCGLVLLDSFEWMTGRPPGFDTWGVCFVAMAME